MGKYYKADFYLYTKSNIDSFGNIIVKHSALGYSEICTNQKLKREKFLPLSPTGKNELIIANLSEAHYEEVVNYINNFDFESFNDAINSVIGLEIKGNNKKEIKQMLKSKKM